MGMLNLTLDRNRILQKIFAICHWNHNSIAGHNIAKLVLLKAYNPIHKFDTVCLWETNLDTNILPDDSNFEIPGYNLMLSNHPLN